MLPPRALGAGASRYKQGLDSVKLPLPWPDGVHRARHVTGDAALRKPTLSLRAGVQAFALRHDWSARQVPWETLSAQHWLKLSGPRLEQSLPTGAAGRVERRD